MVTSNRPRYGKHQARAIQERRVTAGKLGYARAVRRYLHRLHVNYVAYLDARQALPVKWLEVKQPAEIADAQEATA